MIILNAGMRRTSTVLVNDRHMQSDALGQSHDELDAE